MAAALDDVSPWTRHAWRVDSPTFTSRSSHEEERIVHEWRVEQLVALGFPIWLADTIAHRVDWHDIAALVERGCPPRLALDIVR
jgi:hypothetical protein